MRVVVVDDSAFMRRAIRSMLESDSQIEVVAVGRNGREGLELVKKHKPDLVTLDIEMPEMDGLTALRHIMRACPTQVLMVSSLTTEGSHAALRALQLGAADVLAKDASQFSLSITNLQADLLAKAKALAGSASRRRLAQRTAAAPVVDVPRFRPGQFDVVCIGASTGGPPVLEAVLAVLPAELSAPIVVAQHMPAIFTESMAGRLSRACRLPVHHVSASMPMPREGICIAVGGKHLHVEKSGLAKWQLRVSDQPREALYRPSVDALFDSAGRAAGARALGIVLTGMGSDGLEGGRTLRQAGGTLLAQSEETCVVYGMPKAVTENGLVSASLPPRGIAQALRSLARPSSAVA
ncbi:MAG: chemotaxis-specific protein-glutamate methyltransferase CheB [Phycisphaeraceae bacterium]